MSAVAIRIRLLFLLLLFFFFNCSSPSLMSSTVASERVWKQFFKSEILNSFEHFIIN